MDSYKPYPIKYYDGRDKLIMYQTFKPFQHIYLSVTLLTSTNNSLVCLIVGTLLKLSRNFKETDVFTMYWYYENGSAWIWAVLVRILFY